MKTKVNLTDLYALKIKLLDFKDCFLEDGIPLDYQCEDHKMLDLKKIKATLQVIEDCIENLENEFRN